METFNLEDVVVLKNGKVQRNQTGDNIQPVVRTSAYHIGGDVETVKEFLKNNSLPLYKLFDSYEFSVHKRMSDYIEMCRDHKISLSELYAETTPMILYSAVMTHLKYPFIDYDYLVVVIMEGLEEFVKKDRTSKTLTQFLISRIRIKMSQKIDEIYSHQVSKEKEVVPTKLINSALDMKDMIECVLDKLNDRERLVIVYRFGLGDLDSLSYDGIGEIMKITGTRVKQIEAKALRKMKSPSNRKKLEGLLDGESYCGCVRDDEYCHGKIATMLKVNNNPLTKEEIDEIESKFREMTFLPEFEQFSRMVYNMPVTHWSLQDGYNFRKYLYLHGPMDACLLLCNNPYVNSLDDIEAAERLIQSLFKGRALYNALSEIDINEEGGIQYLLDHIRG